MSLQVLPYKGCLANLVQINEFHVKHLHEYAYIYKNIYALHIFNFLFFSMNSGVWSCDSVLLEFIYTRREILVLFAYRLNVYNIRIIIVFKKTIYSIVSGNCFIDLIS